MEANTQLNERRLADAWAELHNHAHNGNPLQADANRMAFADPEFMFRRETRGIRFQLEMLKPDLGQAEQGIESTVVVYGSARFVAPDEAAAQLADAEASGDAERVRRARLAVRNAGYYDLARQFAKLVADYSERQRPADRIYICTGGGPGIMEAANRGATEVGAPTVGHNIVLPQEQAPNAWVTPELCFRFHYFALRKMHLLTRARALVVFPGGYGTLDELFETLCLIQTGKARSMPVLLFDESYWRSIINFDAMVEQGVIDARDLEIFRFVETAEQAWQLIREHYATRE